MALCTLQKFYTPSYSACHLEIQHFQALNLLCFVTVARWNNIPLIQPQLVDEESEARRRPKAKPEVKKKPQRKGGLFIPPMDGGTVEELGKY